MITTLMGRQNARTEMRDPLIMDTSVVGQVEVRDLPLVDECSSAGVAVLHLPYD